MSRRNDAIGKRKEWNGMGENGIGGCMVEICHRHLA